MVVTLLYTCTGTEIGTKIWRYRAESRKRKYTSYLLIVWDWLEACGWVWFGWFGWFGLVQIFAPP